MDKYGRPVDKQDTSMLKYYNLEKDENDDQREEEKQNYYDEEGKFKWEAESSDDNE